RTTDRTLICYDDDEWGDWVKDHSDAKGLKNKPFPYYNDQLAVSDIWKEPRPKQEC
nr:hypothetical protein [Tanacetum cinerariifolium]